MTNDEARALELILDGAGRGAVEDEFGLRYGEAGTTEVSLEFALLLPHEA